MTPRERARAVWFAQEKCEQTEDEIDIIEHNLREAVEEAIENHNSLYVCSRREAHTDLRIEDRAKLIWETMSHQTLGGILAHLREVQAAERERCEKVVCPYCHVEPWRMREEMERLRAIVAATGRGTAVTVSDGLTPRRKSAAKRGGKEGR